MLAFADPQRVYQLLAATGWAAGRAAAILPQPTFPGRCRRRCWPSPRCEACGSGFGHGGRCALAREKLPRARA